MNAITPSLRESLEPQRPAPRRRRMIAVAVVGIIAFVTAITVGLDLVSFVPVQTHPIAISPDPELTKRAVLHTVPVGCSVWLARDLMEMNGFKCRFRRHSDFVTYRPDGRSVRDFSAQDYLYCQKIDPVVVGISGLQYEVALTVNKKGVISNAYVNTTPVDLTTNAS